MATTTKSKAPATAGAAETSGAATGDLAAQTNTGVNDGNDAPSAGNAEPPGQDGGAADSVLPANGEVLSSTGTEVAAQAADALATPGASAAVTTLASDDVQTSAKDASGEFASAFAPHTVNQVLDELRALHPDDLVQARAQINAMTTALEAFDRERLSEAAGESELAVTARGVVLFSAGALRFPIGDLVEGTESQISNLAKSGDVDPHPDAVAVAVARNVVVHLLGE